MINNSKQVWQKKQFDNQYTEARQVFTLEEIPEKAVFSIYSETEYALYINKSFVGCGQYRSMDNRRVYDEYEAESLLHSGKNEIFVIANHQGANTSTYLNRQAGIAFSLDFPDGKCILSGEETKIRPSAKYKSGQMEKTSVQLGFVYYYDASAEDSEWQQPEIVSCGIPFEKRPIKKLSHEKLACGKILSQGLIERTTDGTVAEMMQKDYLSFREKSEIFGGNTIRKSDGGAYFVIDLEDEYAGLFTMSVDAAGGTVIDVSYGEHLDDLRVRSAVGGRNFAVRYVCRDGKQDFTGFFRRFAGRYLEIHITNMKSDVTFEKVGLISTVYPLSNKEHFKCNDHFYNRLFDISVKTLKLCMHEHYEDCPWREQALYAFDSLVQMLCGYYAYGEYEFPKQSLRLLSETQMEDGLLAICAPGGNKRTIPSFSLCFVISLEKYVLYSGDISFGKEMLPVAEKILSAFSPEDNIVNLKKKETYWHFYEWSAGLDGELNKYENYDTDAPINFYYIIAAESFNKICSYIGKEEKYDLDGIKKKVKEVFFNKESGLFRTDLITENYHEFTQSLALLSGVCGENEKEYIKNCLIGPCDELIKTTLSTSLYKYDALLSDGLSLIDRVSDEIAEIWGDMIYSGAKTLWETSKGGADFDNAGSLCHAWSAVPVYVLYKYIIGFEPTKPGFSKYKLKPQATEYIDKIEARLFTPTGSKDVRIENGKVK